jgi:probable phosphoglycerate mutase
MVSANTSENRRLILLRHGESTTNRNHTLTGRTDPLLTRKGKLLTKRASQYIKKRWSRIDALYCSPLIRAVDTALIVAKKMKTPIVKDDLLLETNFGLWEGLEKEDLKNQPEWGVYARDPFHFHFPGGESPQDVKKRVALFKQNLLHQDSWENVIIVTHYTPIVYFILSVIGNGDDHRAPFTIDNSSISVLKLTDASAYLEMLNCTP